LIKLNNINVLKLYSIFHLNLIYSSIEIEERPEVIEKCYWPLLKLAGVEGIPIGIELSGYTLEKISEIDPEWIKTFRKLLKEREIELIGSGYAQIIGPLVPAKVNDWNQKLGLEIYKKILGIRPQIALVNEMAYSGGIIEHYLNNNYKAIIMEWNNPRRYYLEWKNEYRYFPQYAVGTDNRKIALIWADSIAFQKFQRYAQGEIDLEEYLRYLKSHYNNEENRYFPLYANDVEVFDFRPNRYDTEVKIDKQREWQRVRDVFSRINKIDYFKLISSSEILRGLDDRNAGNKLRLESPEQPIPVKKQEKYNIYRWALTGRDDLYINTVCYKIYNAFLKGNPNKEDWKELCYLWQSDFRTHITDKRWGKYLERLDNFKERWNIHSEIKCKSGSQKKIKIPDNNKKFLLNEDRIFLYIETKFIRLSLNKIKGLTISELRFKNIHKEPLVGTLPHGYYDEISLGADFYSGHAIIEKPGEHRITDLLKSEPEVLSDGVVIIIRSSISDKNIQFNREYRISLEDQVLEIVSDIRVPGRELAIIHPMNITFIPTSFNRASLFYAAHNGGGKIEKFKIIGDVIEHGRSLSSLISAKHGLGATEGLVIIGDKEKQVCIWHDPAKSALIPTIKYQLTENNQYFLRLQYSAQELDETFKRDEQELVLKFHWKLKGSLS